MENFRIELDKKNDVITVKYYDFIFYKTLLDSLSELLRLKIKKRFHIVLDFSEVESFFISYCQITNFRKSLKSLLPKVKASRIAVINAPKASWGDIASPSMPCMEDGSLIFDIRGFQAHQKKEAYQWV